jgi:hypothetical protein
MTPGTLFVRSWGSTCCITHATNACFHARRNWLQKTGQSNCDGTANLRSDVGTRLGSCKNEPKKLGREDGRPSGLAGKTRDKVLRRYRCCSESADASHLSSEVLVGRRIRNFGRRRGVLGGPGISPLGSLPQARDLTGWRGWGGRLIDKDPRIASEKWLVLME